MPRPVSFATRCFGVLLAAAACSPEGNQGLDPIIPIAKRPTQRPDTNVAGAFAELPSGTVGPYLARRRDESLAIWAEPNAAGGMDWVSLRLDAVGRAFGAPQRVGSAPAGLGIVRVRVAEDDATWVVGVGDVDGQSSVSAYKVAGNGSLAAPIAELVAESGSVVWAEVVPTEDGGALVFWAERVGESAQIFTRRVEPDGQADAPARLVYDAARAWQVVSVEAGALLGVISRAGAVDFIPVKEDGTDSPATRLSGTVRAEGEIDLLAVEPNRVLVAFSEEQWLEPHIYTAFVNAKGGRLSEPELAVPAHGPQSMRQLLGNSGAQYLAWLDTREDALRVHVSTLDKTGKSAGPALALPFNTPGALPELAASEARFAALLSPCRSEDCPQVPTLVEFDHDLGELTQTPWVIAGSSVNLGWDLDCLGTACAGLGAVFSERSPVGFLGTRSATAKARAKAGNYRQSGEAAPVEALVQTPELAGLAAQGSAEGTTLAWLSYFDPTVPYARPKAIAPDGRLAPVQAELRTQFIPTGVSSAELATRLPASEVISIRARSVAGVALARKIDRQLLVWSAIDGAAPQVFMTELDAKGHRLHQGMLTRQKGEVLAVRVAATANGWVIAWIDSRRGRPEAYLGLIGSSLERLTPDTRVELADCSVSGLDVAVVGSEIWLAVTDERAGAQAVYVERYDARTLALHAPHAKLETKARALRTPRFASTSDGVSLLWLEVYRDERQLRRTLLTAEGQSPSTQTLLNFETELGTFELACGDSCSALVTEQDADGARLVTLDIAPGSATKPKLLSRLLSSKALAVAPTSAAGSTYYFDVNAEGSSAIHRISDAH